MPLTRPIQGGVQSHVLHLAEQFGRSSNQTTVLSMGHRSESDISPDFTTINVERTTPLGDIAETIRTLESIDPTVVHLHTADPKILLLGMIAQRRWPTVVTVHGLPAEEWVYSSGFERYWKRFGGGFAQNHMIPRIQHRVTVSPYVARQLTVDLQIIPNGVDDRFFDVEVSSLRDSRVRLLFVGSVVPRKALEDAIVAVDILQDIGLEPDFDIVGRHNDEEYIRQLSTIVEKRGLRNRVSFHGRVEDDRLPAFYREADVFVFPSREESQGIVLLEAMATGTPIVGSDAAAIPEVIESNEAGMVYPVGEPELLASAIEVLVQEPDTYARFQDRGRENAEQFRWYRIAEKLERYYREIIN